MGTKIGYARCSADEQDLEDNRRILLELGVPAGQIYLDRRTRAATALARVWTRPSTARQAHLLKLHATGEHTIAELAESFEGARQTVYRLLERAARTAA